MCKLAEHFAIQPISLYPKLQQQIVTGPYKVISNRPTHPVKPWIGPREYVKGKNETKIWKREGIWKVSTSFISTFCRFQLLFQFWQIDGWPLLCCLGNLWRNTHERQHSKSNGAISNINCRNEYCPKVLSVVQANFSYVCCSYYNHIYDYDNYDDYYYHDYDYNNTNKNL